MATRAAMKNVDQIWELGDMPVEMAEPILKQIADPNQLYSIELSSPQFVGQTGKYWKAFILRDCHSLTAEKVPEPSNPASWHKVYRRCRNDEKAIEAAQEEELRKSLLGEKVKKAEKSSVFVGKIMSHARDEKETNMYVDGVRNKHKNDPGFDKRPTSLKNAKTGADAIAAIRRQNAQRAQQKAMIRPFQQQPAGTRQIKQAPASMVREIQKRGPQEIAPRPLLPHQKEMLKEKAKLSANLKIQAPGRLSNSKFAAAHQARNDAAVREARQINEAKLRALTKSDLKPAPVKKFEFEKPPQSVSPPPAAIQQVTKPKVKEFDYASAIRAAKESGGATNSDLKPAPVKKFEFEKPPQSISPPPAAMQQVSKPKVKGFDYASAVRAAKNSGETTEAQSSKPRVPGIVITPPGSPSSHPLSPATENAISPPPANSPPPGKPMVKKRPASSVFMPSKKTRR